MEKYTYSFENGEYVIYKNGNVLRSPERRLVVKTPYEELAKRMVHDLKKYGDDFGTLSNIFSLYYTLTERVESLGRDWFESSMIDQFLTYDDWYFMYGVTGGPEAYMRSFEWSFVKKAIQEWLSKITLMQMVAACCVGKAYESLYVAFCFASLVEDYDGNVPDDEFWVLFDEFPVNNFCARGNDFISDFRSFELFYSFHLKENGPAIEKIDE